MIVAASWESVTAIATLGLAFVTAWLAASTRKLAREATRETRANWRPVLVVETKPGERGTMQRLEYDPVEGLRMTLRNIGRGPALRVSAFLKDPDDPERAMRPSISSEVVAPGDAITLTWNDFEPPDQLFQNPLIASGAWATYPGTITCGDVSYWRHETIITIGLRIDGLACLLNQRIATAPERSRRVVPLLHELQWSAWTWYMRAKRSLARFSARWRRRSRPG